MEVSFRKVARQYGTAEISLKYRWLWSGSRVYLQTV